MHKGAAELSGLELPVLEHFSKRRQAMLREADEGAIGLASKAAAESAALATRDRKQYGVQTHTWREEVRARAGELGLGADELADLIEAGRARIDKGLAPREALDEQTIGDHLASPTGLTERSNTFDERDVLQGFAAAARQGALAGEVRGQAERFAERADTIETARGEMTTAELVGCERRLVVAAFARAGERTAVVESPHLDRALAASERSVTTEQAEAVRSAAACGHGVTVIEALAGTGKTYTAGVLRQVYEDAGYEVLGVAPTGRAARELADNAGVAARTLDRLLFDLEQVGDELPHGCVLILDEAGMAATRASARLLEAAQRASAKFIAIGDPAQLASVQAGGWLGALARGIGSVRLTEVIRQRDPAERRALAALHERNPRRYLDWAVQAGRIRTFPDATGACEQALDEWARAVAEAGLAQVVIIARDNETREALNRAARGLRRTLGLLGEECSYGTVELAAGDRVICRRNDRLFEVDNGMRGTVRALDSDRVVIDTDSGLVRELPAAYVAEHLEHAYSLTGHGIQGGTVERALVVASPKDLSAGWSYTALSRARGETRLLLYDRQLAAERSEFAPKEQTQTPARSDLLPRVQRRMLERDDEELAIEQLSTVGRADDTALESARGLGNVPAQEVGAARAEPTPSTTATPSRLRELGERIGQLQTQLQTLPTHQLRRIEHFEERALVLSTQREQLAQELSLLPEPRRRFGREHDTHAIERAHLISAIEAHDRELRAVQIRRMDLQHELGDPAEARAERDALQGAIRESTRERDEVRHELGEREVRAPGPWVRDIFGERPDVGWAREQWESDVRKVAGYRAQYEIADPADALGPAPETGEQRHYWEQAKEAIELAERSRSCHLDGIDIGIGF